MHRYFLSRASVSPSVQRPFAVSRLRPHLLKRHIHSNAVATTKASRLPLKTLATGAALTSVSFYYYYHQRENELSRRLLNIAQTETEMSMPMSAFSVSTPTGTMAELMDDESRAAMQAKSTKDLLLAMFVYKMCTFSWLVDLAPHMIQFAETAKLEGPVYWFIKKTFFSQFCGGETPEECISSMDRLAQSGINCILDLSVEADLHLDEVAPVLLDDLREPLGKYWRQEQNADVIVEMTKSCLLTAARGQQYSSSGAFAAIKVTAFAPPELLLRLNRVLYCLDQTFQKHQVEGKVNATALQDVVDHVLPPPQSDIQREQRDALVTRLRERNGTLDYIEFSKLFNIQGPARDVWWATRENRESHVLLTEDELQAYDRMASRLDEVCSLAHEKGVGIMIDAEQSYFQEAIDHMAMNLQAIYNRRDDKDHTPTVYNTYQMYAKASQGKLERDVERARRENFAFAAKLVRGAYMVSERKRALQMNYPSPIHDTLEDTHASFNGGVRFLLDKLSQHQEQTKETLTSTTAPVVFMVASHNRESVILTVKEMERHNVLPRSGVVHFGQLFGMQDQISYTLGKNGYSIYKYLPYGKIDEVIPYLLRRAQENSALLGGVAKERRLMWQEVKDRVVGAGSGSAVANSANVPSNNGNSSALSDEVSMNTATETA